MNRLNDNCMVLTTTNTQENADALIRVLFEHRLAACIQTMAIHSHYLWQNKLCCDDETLLIIKTQTRCYLDVERMIVANHPYDVPQVVQVPIVDGFNPYLEWIKQSTSCL